MTKPRSTLDLAVDLLVIKVIEGASLRQLASFLVDKLVTTYGMKDIPLRRVRPGAKTRPAL